MQVESLSGPSKIRFHRLLYNRQLAYYSRERFLVPFSWSFTGVERNLCYLAPCQLKLVYNREDASLLDG